MKPPIQIYNFCQHQNSLPSVVIIHFEHTSKSILFSQFKERKTNRQNFLHFLKILKTAIFWCFLPTPDPFKFLALDYSLLYTRVSTLLSGANSSPCSNESVTKLKI